MRLSPAQAVALAVAVVIMVLLSLAVGRLTAPNPAPPSTMSAAAGFARDMQEHHNQAVELALIVRDKTDDADTRLMAYDIATSQSQQSGQMFGWLAEWGLPQAPAEPSMTWMSRPAFGASRHDHAADSAHRPGSPMPGLATYGQLQQLSGSEGVDAERLFLQLMIAHHQGGVEMAEAIVERSSHRVVLDLANSIVQSQASEIELMKRMLAERS